jgi:hypothetical protein
MLLCSVALAGAARAGVAQAPADARALAARVAAAGDRNVRLTYALRPGVCGIGGNIHTRGDDGTTSIRGDNWTTTTSRSSEVSWETACEPGPGRLVLEVRGGEVQRVRTYVGGQWRATDAVDLGEVAAPVVTGYLLGLAESAPDRAARDAIFPATLAAGAAPYPVLLRIARNAARPREVRNQAVFWLGQAAGEAVTRDLRQLAAIDTVDREIKRQVVFALSRRPKDEAVPALIDVARTHRDPEIRRQALFWLGRIDDPRALSFIEGLVTR